VGRTISHHRNDIVFSGRWVESRWLFSGTGGYLISRIVLNWMDDQDETRKIVIFLLSRDFCVCKKYRNEHRMHVYNIFEGIKTVGKNRSKYW